MSGAGQRLWGLVYRHLCLYRRSWPRVLEAAYWPTLNMLVWGFTATFLAHLKGGPAAFGGALIAGVLLWEFTLRAQTGFSFTFLEDIWSRNLGHVFVSPVRPAEFLLSLIVVSILRAAAGLIPAMIIAYALYRFNLLAMGPVLVVFLFNLLVMGWWLALGVTALLFRYGAGAEALAWTLAFALTPISCVFYPLAALPHWLQPLAGIFPAAHIFEGMRAALFQHVADWRALGWATALNAGWIAAALLAFAGQFRAARIRGALISIGE